MLCVEFEDRLTDYLDGALAAEGQRVFAEHAMRCPVCHELLNEVRNAVSECRASAPPAPSPGLEARIIMKTAPESSMSCAEFEEHLTDYLDGFLPAALYHRWERHAALCQECTELPGQVVRSIGACYSYISIEQPVPEGLHARILQATLGTTQAQEVRPPLAARIVERVRGWLDVVVQPQFATVATMVLLAVFVGTQTISEDGSIGGVYHASVRLAAATYSKGASSPDIKRVVGGIETLVGAPARDGAAATTVNENKSQPPAEPQKDEPKK
jgi:anti-sigma factor RsiW